MLISLVTASGTIGIHHLNLKHVDEMLDDTEFSFLPSIQYLIQHPVALPHWIILKIEMATQQQPFIEFHWSNLMKKILLTKNRKNKTVS